MSTKSAYDKASPVERQVSYDHLHCCKGDEVLNRPSNDPFHKELQGIVPLQRRDEAGAALVGTVPPAVQSGSRQARRHANRSANLQQVAGQMNSHGWSTSSSSGVTLRETPMCWRLVGVAGLAF